MGVIILCALPSLRFAFLIPEIRASHYAFCAASGFLAGSIREV